jgi:aspartyl-tRNA(Asn)/glutamyl-tRNA(Gln) amidotransferase subunit A
MPLTAEDLRFTDGNTPAELAERCLAATDTPVVFLAVTAERARAEAAASAKRHAAGAALGPLDGLPVTYKDLIDVAGFVTTSGSRTTAENPAAAADAECVRQLGRAGAVCIGKTNLSEFAFSGLGINPHFGTPANPADSGRIPGGSSSGAAVAVAVGAAVASVCTDTSGSVRVPAAFTGLVGFRPTQARYSRDRVAALADSLDTVGVITTGVAQAALFDAVLGTPAEPAGPATELIVPDGDIGTDLEPAVARNFAEFLRTAAARGMRITERRVPPFDSTQSVMADFGTLVAAEAHDRLIGLLDTPAGALIDPWIVRRIRAGVAADRAALLERRPALIEALRADIGDALLAFPTVRHVAPERAPLEADYDTWAAVNALTLRATMPGSYLDMPAIALPTGRDNNGLPTSVQLSGPIGSDDRVLRTALRLEIGPQDREDR